MYKACEHRYDRMQYRRSGRSGLKLPILSLGLWHNFGSIDSYEKMKDMCFTAFDHGITHFDLANNYGPIPGSAEENFGRILKSDFSAYRDEMVISTKAGYEMWAGPYGNFGSRKYLMASLDGSLKRMGLDYVDIFYHHRPDQETPLEETMEALSDIVRSGKALYVGISNYGSEDMKRAAKILRENHTPLLINQVRYSMFDRHIEKEELGKYCKEEGVGIICFSPLAQGLLTERYLNGIPEGSRAKKNHFLKEEMITEELLGKVRALNELAKRRDQSLAEMALAWVIREDSITSVLIGASSSEQILQNLKFGDSLEFSAEEIEEIERILKEK